MDPDPNAAAVMAAVDRLPKPWRTLVYEYGAKIVLETWADGTRNAKAAKGMLETWRERRQTELLSFLDVPHRGIPIARKKV